MIDPKYIRNQLETVAASLSRRGFKLDTDFVQTHETERKSLQMTQQKLQGQRNQLSKEVGLQKAKGLNCSDLVEQVQKISSQLQQISSDVNFIQEKLQDYYLHIPNLPAEDVPYGLTEADNVIIRTWGTPVELDFPAKEHHQLASSLAEMDFQVAAKLTGSRFVILKGQLASLHRALSQFMLDTHIHKHNYTEVHVPYMVSANAMQNSGQLPKFKEDIFQLDFHDYALIPTGEVPLANLLADTITKDQDLPLKYVTHTPCFRKEAGSYGRDTHGMLRQHQFDKVELFRFCTAEKADQALEELTFEAETILQMLELPYRVAKLCTGDLGFAACKTYDLEVWLPGQQSFREISSCSNCSDFQARRMQARVKHKQGTELVHTLNGSGLAVGRTLIAILENYQQADGSIVIPKVLQPYLQPR